MGNTSVGSTKWWENTGLVAIFAACTAMIPPITAGVSSYINGEAQIRLQKQKQIHEIQVSYLDRALDPERSLEYRLGILDFLSNSLQDETLRKWAIETKSNVLSNIKSIKNIDTSLTSASERVVQTERQIQKISKESSDSDLTNKKLIELASQLAEARAEIKKLNVLKEKYEQLSKTVTATSVISELPLETKQSESNFRPPVGLDINAKITFTNNGEGIEFRPPRNTDILSVGNGKVAFSDWLRGYGLMAIIDHGEGLLSVYGKNSALTSQVGDTVSAGDIIAISGDKGLYFEMRKKGKPMDASKTVALLGIEYNNAN